MRKVFRLFIAPMALLLIAGVAIAQTSRTTGALTGNVTDASGAALPGVTVTVTSPQLQGSRTAVTDSNGEYTLPLLPPGTYRATYELAGLQTATRDNITISLNQTTKINVPLQVGAVSEVVTVTANQVVVDPTATQTQVNFKEDHLKYAAISSTNRTYQNVLFQAPAATGNANTGASGNPMVSGANVAQNDYLLDGINTTDPVTHTFGNNLPFNTIQEISIQTLGKDAEYGSSGGTVNVITKSGGNTLRGSAEMHYRNGRLQTQGSATHPTGIPFFGGTPSGSALNFNKNTRPSMSSTPEVEVDGPILRDRLWFMVGLMRPRTATTNPNIFGFQPGSRTFVGWNNQAKVTFTPLANQTLAATYLQNYATIQHSTNSSFVSPEADAITRQANRTYGLRWDAIFSSKLLANVIVGHTPGSLSTLPISGTDRPGTLDDATGIQTGNYNNAQARNSKRDELVASSSYYLTSFGTHGLKAGIDFNKTDFSYYNNFWGNPSLIPGYQSNFCSPQFGFPAGSQCVGFIETNPSATVPQRINLSVFNPLHTVSSKQYAYFAQDEWNPISRLTVRAGLRYQQINWDSQSVTSPPTFKMWQPRFGVAYDIFNNARSVVHGYAGKVMDDNQLTLPTYGVSQPSGSAFFNLNPATGQYAYDPSQSIIFATGEVFDRNLKPSFSNQFSLGYTQMIWRNTSIDITGEYRKQKNLFEDYCGTLSAPLDNCVVTNQPGFDQGQHNVMRAQYRGIATKIESRPYNWLDVLASWTHSRSEGSYGSNFNETQNAFSSFDFYPQHFTNTFGFLNDDARNRVKLNGYATLPMQFTVGAQYYWDSGTPWTVFRAVAPYGSLFIEPRGSRRLPSLSQTDLQLTKEFRVAGLKLALIGSVLNVFNSETATAINGNAGTRAIADPTTGRLLVITDPNFNNTGKPYQQVGPNRISATFGQPTQWQQPRRYEAGLRVEF